MYFVFFAMKCRNRFIEHSLQLSVNTCLQYCKKRQRLSNTTWLWNFSLCFEIGDLEKEMYFVDLGDLGDRRSWLSWRLLILAILAIIDLGDDFKMSLSSVRSTSRKPRTDCPKQFEFAYLPTYLFPTPAPRIYPSLSDAQRRVHFREALVHHRLHLGPVPIGPVTDEDLLRTLPLKNITPAKGSFYPTIRLGNLQFSVD